MEEQKQIKTIIDVATDLGLELEQAGEEFRCCCPSSRHEDQHPSLYINPSKDCFICYGCSVGGGPAQLYALATGCSVEEAYSAVGLNGLGAELLRRLQGKDVDEEADIGPFLFASILRRLLLERKPFAPELAEALCAKNPTPLLEAYLK